MVSVAVVAAVDLENSDRHHLLRPNVNQLHRADMKLIDCNEMKINSVRNIQMYFKL